MATLVLFCVLFAFTVVHGQPWIPAPNPQQDWMQFIWMERFQQNVANSRANGSNINVLFYGDSITEGWNDHPALWEQSFGRLGAANYGIAGDGTQHVLWRLFNGEVENLNPRVVVLKIGSNNVNSSPEPDTARGVQAVVNELRIRLPNSRILLLGILPRNNSGVTARVQLVNSILSGFQNANTIRYLDMGDSFYFDREFIANRFTGPDFLHLSLAGYNQWNEDMNPLFTELWNLQ